MKDETEIEQGHQCIGPGIEGEGCKKLLKKQNGRRVFICDKCQKKINALGISGTRKVYMVVANRPCYRE